jgi:hypothetical protein
LKKSLSENPWQQRGQATQQKPFEKRFYRKLFRKKFDQKLA